MSNLDTSQSINFPEVRTYWIAYTDTLIFCYGYIDPDQELSTGQPYLYSSTDESAWITELQTEFGVPYPDLPEGQTWGYQYETEEEGKQAIESLSEADINAYLQHSTDPDFYFISYEPGMEEVLGVPTRFSYT